MNLKEIVRLGTAVAVFLGVFFSGQIIDVMVATQWLQSIAIISVFLIVLLTPKNMQARNVVLCSVLIAMQLYLFAGITTLLGEAVRGVSFHPFVLVLLATIMLSVSILFYNAEMTLAAQNCKTGCS